MTPDTPPHSPTPPGPEPRDPGTSAAETTPETASKSSFLDYLTDPRARRIEWLFAGLAVAVGLFAFVITRGDLVAQALPGPAAPEEVEVAEAAPERDLPNRLYTTRELELHADRRYPSYFTGAVMSDADNRGAGSAFSALDDFQTQLEVYRRRAGVDDNFSIRVYDNRTWQTLEVYTLTELRDRYLQTGQANWDQVNAHRRDAQNRLTQKWVARGIPNSAISSRWGYATQMREARQREEQFIEYEIRYARQLGLSLLTTEIGSVETFNQDWMVSPVGARGRYQFMPANLRLFGIHTYDVPTASGRVTVREELSTLLALQAAFMLVKGYSNAVGHEIPGVSGYHTGPGNIFHLYQTFLRAKSNDPAVNNATVSEAYMWGVTEGFERVRQQSSFGPHSRGYVLSAYGALRATEEIEIDPSKTLWTEQVRLNTGQQITLSALLDLLEPHEGRLDWGAGIEGDTAYERFRNLNTHIDLPAATGSGVPAAGDLRLTASAGNHPLRFFLPYGATEVLERIRPALLNPRALVRFDDNVFADPAVTGEKTQADYEYERLVMDVYRFGFSNQNRNRLERLFRQFTTLAEEQPTPYRLAQLRIISTHRQVWQTRAFNDLAGTVQNVISGRGADASAG